MLSSEPILKMENIGSLLTYVPSRYPYFSLFGLSHFFSTSLALKPLPSSPSTMDLPTLLVTVSVLSL